MMVTAVPLPACLAMPFAPECFAPKSLGGFAPPVPPPADMAPVAVCPSTVQYEPSRWLASTRTNTCLVYPERPNAFCRIW